METQNYQWQGEPVKVEHGHCVVKQEPDKPLYWYNYEVSLLPFLMVAHIPAIRITTGDGTSFCIANHYGVGVSKLIKGGWPDHVHFSLSEETFSPTGDIDAWFSFDEEQYSRHEAERRAWQKKNFPEEFERMEALRRSVNFKK